jgi:tetratricopeptide (TPR) repeat protein
MLSVFPADFDLAGAAAVWEMKEMLAEDALGELIRWSLVDFLPSATNEGGRYRLHDLARDFAESRLDEADSETAKLRHAEHYIVVLARAKEIFKQGKEATLKGLQLFDQERANILAGQSWAERNLEGTSAVIDLCKSYPNAGVYVLDLRLSPHEKIPWLETALEASRKSYDRSAEEAHLGNLGLAYSNLGEPCKAIEFYEQALKISRDIRDRRIEAMSLLAMSISYHSLCQKDKAFSLAQSALEIFEQIESPHAETVRQKLAEWSA